MAKKLEISGNFLKSTDTVSGIVENRVPTLYANYRIYSDTLHIIYVNRHAEDFYIQLANIVDFNGDPFPTQADLEAFLDEGLGGAASNTVDGAIVDLATNDIGRDAWGRPKTIADRSIFHGMFTYNVPIPTWQEKINDVISTTFTNSTSFNGKLNLSSGAALNDTTELRTFRNPRYEPNRGHLYSTSIFLPNPTASGVRRFGFFTAQSGAFFSVKSDGLYAVVRSTVDSVTTEDEYLIDTTGIDLSKGNTFDIQMQWRGVGNYKFFINLKQVKKIEYIGTLTELTTFNPANPICFECENLGDNVVLECGCVDITSEGGEINGKTYGSVTIDNEVGEVDVTGFNQPVIALRSKLTIGGLINTRDTLALLASAYAEEKAIIRIWATRDFTAITEGNQSFEDFGDGHLEYVSRSATSTMTFDTTKADLIFGCRVNKDSTYATSALFEGRTSIYLTPGDMFVFTMHRENGGIIATGVTFEFAEEI